ncbi:MAG: Do family serine endopeptidase [Methyloligellaceae bacterium]
MLKENKTLSNMQTASDKRKWKKTALFAMAGAATLGLASLQLADGISSAKADPKATTGQSVPLGYAPISFADLAAKVKPAVVSINVKSGGKSNRQLPKIPKELFKHFGIPRGGQLPPSRAQGSGFIVSEEGFVVTNNHVVEKGVEITVTFENGDTLPAKLIGSDPRTDLALLKITKKGKYPTVKFAEKAARVGDWVLAVGNPFGLGGTVTAGIVSAKNRNIGSGPYDYLQIDAAVNRGNSGGPAFNLAGEVVGVNTAIFSPSGGNVGIAFAVPATLTKKVIEQLKQSGSVSRGWLGVHIQTVSEDIAEGLGMEKAYGAIVTKVTKGGPADKSDLKNGDVIINVNGSEIKDSRDLARKIAALPPKQDANLIVFRDGKEKPITVKLGLFPNNRQFARLQSGQELGEELDDLGLTLAPANSRPGKDKEGVVITEVAPGSAALEKGLKAGDVILKAGRSTVNQPDDVIKAISAAKKAGQPSILLYIKSGDRRSFVAVSLKKAS